MKQRAILMLFVVLVSTGLTTGADQGRIAIAGRAGTLGLGGDLMLNVLSDLNIRFGVGAFNFDYDDEYSGIDYDFELDLLTFPITVDWYPFDGAFHLSGGIIINQTEVSLDSRYSDSLTVGDTTYDSGDIGVLSGDVSFNDIAPYVGIGWGNAFGPDRRWGFMTDLGIAFTGSPNVALSATGALASDPGLLADLAQEEADLEDDLDDFKIYPVFSANLYFRF